MDDELHLDTYDDLFADATPVEPAYTPPTTFGIDFESELNDQQYDVVTSPDGPALILAGAGSGKTRVLIYRLAYLIQHGIDPSRILLVTFTNKAANEMKTRAERLLGIDISSMWMGTFHSIGARILRREAQRLGYTPDFTILDEDDALDIVDEAMEELGLKKDAKTFPKKNLIHTIHSLSVNSQRNIDDTVMGSFPHLEEFLVHIRRISLMYTQKKKELNVMDFDDLLTNWLRLLQIDEIHEKYTRLFQHILVDEYQDTNRVQADILIALAQHHKNILAVGDDAQSIYSFRAAEIKNILEFPKIFEGTKVYKLEKNYRSTPQILTLANQSIKNNRYQFDKELTAMGATGTKPVLVKAGDAYKQARFVVQRIKDHLREGTPWTEIAVLARSRFQASELEMELIKEKLPYVIRGGKRFFEQQHIKDVLAHLKMIQNPRDELAFRRAIGLKNGVGLKCAAKVYDLIMREGLDDAAAAKKTTAKQQAGVSAFLALRGRLAAMTQPAEMIRAVIEEYHDYAYATFEDYEDRLSSLDELVRMAERYDALTPFTEALGLYEGFESERQGQNLTDVVVISTIHQAKGLEWDVVFILGLNELEFPHPRSLATSHELEEERRLFYVASTRTRKRLYLMYPEMKYSRVQGPMYARPSMFVLELPAGLFDKWVVS